MSILRALKLVESLGRLERPDLEALHVDTGIPTDTVKKQISGLRSNYGMEIRFVPDRTGKRGNTGYYSIENWGVFDREALAEFIGKQVT